MQREIIQDEKHLQSQTPVVDFLAHKNSAHEFKRDIVTRLVNQSLLEYNSEFIELISRSLFEKYRCEISDCFEKPCYLIDVLRFVYEDTYPEIVGSIKDKLSQFSQESGIKEFVRELEISV